MRELPGGLDAEALLAVVRSEWDGGIVRLEYLPVGFGAHHWAASTDDGPTLFVTLDRLDAMRPYEDRAAAYAGAVALSQGGLEFVLAPLIGSSGSPIVRFAAGAVSCTPWRTGTSGGELDGTWTANALARLHSADQPPGIPRWQPLVSPDFATEVEQRLGEPWGPGPYADDAKCAVGEHLADLARWTDRYHELARDAERREWVTTHGEPHSANQLMTSNGRYLVDWETLKLAPPERDLRELVDVGVPVAVDADMVEIFDLEWRLDEISQYTSWFAAEHHGTEDDRIAFDGLIDELTRA